MQEPNPVYRFLKNIWPTVYRIINSFLFFVLSMTKKTVIYAIKQIKGTI
jgi:hypothetical protein